MLKCSYCSSLLPPDSLFCKTCGATLTPRIETGEGPLPSEPSPGGNRKSSSGRPSGESRATKIPDTARQEALNEDFKGLEELFKKAPEMAMEEPSRKRIRLKRIKRRHHHLFPHLNHRKKGEWTRNILLTVVIVLLALGIAFMLLRYLERGESPEETSTAGSLLVGLCMARLDDLACLARNLVL